MTASADARLIVGYDSNVLGAAKLLEYAEVGLVLQRHAHLGVLVKLMSGCVKLKGTSFSLRWRRAAEAVWMC